MTENSKTKKAAVKKSAETETDVKDVTEVSEAAVAQQMQQPTLGINDLAMLVNVVKLAFKRGAFELGEETDQVNEIFKRLNTFVSYSQEQARVQAEAEAAAAAEADKGGE